MGSPRWHKVWRDLRLHPSRTLLVIAAMVVGLVGAGSVLDTWSLMRQVTREEYRASRPPSATLRLDTLDARDLAAVRALPAIAWAQARRTVTGSVRVIGAAASHTLQVFARDDYTGERIGKVVQEAGVWPPSTHGIVVEHSSMEFAGIQLHDSVSLQVGDGASITVAVDGVARDVGLAPGWMEHVVYTFGTPELLERLGVPNTFNELQLVVRDNTLDRDGIRQVAFDVKRVIELGGHRVTNIDVPIPGEHIHAGQINSLLFTQGAFGALALLLSGILVVNLIGAMLAGQVREIGVMKSLGASARQLAQMYLMSAFVLGVVATAIAIPLAALIGRAYANFTADLLNFSATGFPIPLSAFVLQLIVGLVFPVAAAAIPVVRGCRISVGEALRDVGLGMRTTPTRDGLMARLAAIGGVRRPLLLSLRNTFRKRQRLVLTLLTLATGGAVYIGALNLQQSVRGAVGMIFAVQRYDMAVRLMRQARADSVEQLVRAIGGVSRAEAWGSVRAAVDFGNEVTGNAFAISALPIPTVMLDPTLVSGRWLTADDERTLVVNTRLAADNPRFRVGDSVTLALTGRSERWLVAGVVETGPTVAAYANRAYVSVSTTSALVDRVVIASAFPGAASQLDLMQRLRTSLSDAGFPVQVGQLMSEARAVTEDHLVMVAGFLGMMGQLMIVVGGLALASTMGMAVLERTREIGVLRAIGARHGAIMSMIQIEGLVIALLSWLLAIPLSLPMSVILGRAFSRIMLPLPVSYLPAADGVARWFAVVVVVSVVACAWPAWRATRVTTRAALAYE